MTTRIVVFPRFDEIWPVSADRLRELLEPAAEVELIRVEDGAVPAGSAAVERLFWLGGGPGAAELDGYPALREAFTATGYASDPATDALLAARGIRRLGHPSEGYWAQSVSEFALGLTIDALRGITRRARGVLAGPGPAWEYEAEQLSDDLRFTSGTVDGKRVRIVGAGNIASRYASFVSMLGAEVAAWDPFAAEPAFHRSGARREWRLERLPLDAEIFVPMVPLTDATRGLVTAELIRSIPDGSLVVLATRAAICDVEELRRRVVGDELALAADVFDVEPVPLGDPLLGRANVLHTPHIAGRTLDSGYRWATALAEQLPGLDLTAAPPPTRLRR
ncbi:NAD(P)-dependent oxidoreductase [Galbitalea sp. SE-J8]|uniref:NAD(P)-dependent oxidoreductase n=1 Tax=Galbitalea sp. SE-J8 TaxID=3054952 RepID=UPI00259C7124|nr:NAD(P)-dependent oxidoreductase [Galbitalea sp. SE-J8]MDM4762039.1 NAD(P)-dependent oxidoreductase [Galbitalea sp. SE-J8]